MKGTRSLRTPSELVDARLVGQDQLAALDKVAARYAVAITPAMADLIDVSDPHDPIARQFVPDPRELELATGGIERSDRRRSA